MALGYYAPVNSKQTTRKEPPMAQQFAILTTKHLVEIVRRAYQSRHYDGRRGPWTRDEVRWDVRVGGRWFSTERRLRDAKKVAAQVASGQFDWLIEERAARMALRVEGGAR